MCAVAHDPPARCASARDETTTHRGPQHEERRLLVFGISSEVDQVLNDLASRYGVDQAEVLTEAWPF